MRERKVKQPVRGGVAKVPVIMQMEALECGAACLAMVLAYFGKWIPLEQVRLDCGVSRDGSNMKNVYLAARSYGLEPHGYRMELEGIRSSASFPCMIHWNFNHFVVLDGFRGNKAVINDPARGIVQVPQEHPVFRPEAAERRCPCGGLYRPDLHPFLSVRHHQPGDVPYLL